MGNLPVHARLVMIVMLGALSTSLLAADEAFFKDAAQGGLAEVALGQLAATKASDESVRMFGGEMVREHGAANARLQAAAAQSGVQLPKGLTEDAQAVQEKLASLSGRAFDGEYVRSQIEAHATTLALLEKEIASGTDPAAKAWARESLPMVKRHAEMIGSVGVTPGEHTREHAAGVAGPEDAPRSP